MTSNNRLHNWLKKPKNPGRGQRAWIYLFFPFLLVLFTLSSCTVLPNTIQTSRPVTATMQVANAQYQKIPMSVLLTLTPADETCTDIVAPVQLSWQEMKFYFNVCALQHLSALLADSSAGVLIIDYIAVWCSDCVPVAAVITAAIAVVGANVANLQYASKQCGDEGAFLDISWTGGWRFEPVCTV